MEQKSYRNSDERLQIVGGLIREDSHVRGLAKKLKINHMNASRKLTELSRDNVVDSRNEGRNKVYFLKKTPEAKAAVLMYEHYKLIKLLDLYPRLRKIVERIQKDSSIKIALLFGSYVKGKVKKDSDIDIFVETSDRKLKSELELIDSRVDVKLGKYSRDSALIKEIEKNHAVIKGVEEYYEKNKFFG